MCTCVCLPACLSGCIYSSFLFSHLSSGGGAEDFGRERQYKEERRSTGEYGRASDSYSGDSEPYYSFADKPSRPTVYGRETIPSNDYHHGESPVCIVLHVQFLEELKQWFWH